MGLFSKNNTAAAAPASERQLLMNKYAGSRSNLILVILFTLINIVLLITNSNSYFLFSAAIPYLFADLGMYLCGRYPADWYDPAYEYEFYPNSFFVLMLTIAAVILLVYLACWFFSKKEKYGWLIAALVFFVADTVGMFFVFEITADIALDVVFHAWVIFSLVSGISAALKLKKLPEEEEIPAVEEIPVAEAPAESEPTDPEA